MTKPAGGLRDRRRPDVMEFLARDARHAAGLAVALAGAGVCRTVVHVVGPVPGASVTSIATEPV